MRGVLKKQLKKGLDAHIDGMVEISTLAFIFPCILPTVLRTAVVA